MSTDHNADVLPYSALAAGYDVVMEHVNYDDWAHYVHDLIKEYRPELTTLLELGCGTGTFAFTFAQLGDYRYTGTDLSKAMIRVARMKSGLYRIPIQFEIADFTNYRIMEPVDAALLLYDGLNYVLDPAGILDMLRCTYAALHPGGLFFFDQSTPANSINNAKYFEDEGEVDGFHYVRRSHYDADQRLHTTTFDLTVKGQTYHETHRQRAYKMDEVQALINLTPFEVLHTYDGFTEDPASEASERVHWLLRKPIRGR